MLSFRNASIEDLDIIVKIEASCFPKAEAASYKSLKERILVFPEGFLIARLDGEIIGFINGARTNRDIIIDEMFESMTKYHVKDACNLAIYGVDIHPDFQGKGYSRMMMDVYIQKARINKHKKIILTCKEHLKDYYSSFAYVEEGISNSCHGGAQWYDMSMVL